MRARFYEKFGRWRWSISAPNNKIVARSGRSFKTRRSCERAFWNFAVDVSGDPSVTYLPRAKRKS